MLNSRDRNKVVIEVRQMPLSNAPADLAYEWKIRNGTGGLSGDTDGQGEHSWLPRYRPAGALVTCLANSKTQMTLLMPQKFPSWSLNN